MEKLIILTTIAMLALNSSADSVILNQDANSFSDGGEFVAQITSPNQNYDFITFCVQSQNGFSADQTYNFTESSVDSFGNPLTLGTAFLFAEFENGKITASNPTQDGELQATIWTFQNQQLPVGFTIPTVENNPYYNLALTDLGDEAYQPNNGLYPVAIMQLTDDNGSTAQNQLITSVPESDKIASCTVLAGLIGTIFFFLRKTYEVTM